MNAFFVPQKNIFEGLTKEECKLAQSLLSIAMIIDAVQKKEGKLWCGAKIDLFTFCGFWHYVIADHTNCWTQSLSDLIYAKESKKNSAIVVVNAFLDPIKFESYFPKIVALRFNLLVQTPGKIWPFRSDYNTLGSFFNFSKIDSLGETSHTFYDWKIDFTFIFRIENYEVEKELFAQFFTPNDTVPVNTWFNQCGKKGLKNFCFIKLTSE